MDKIRIVFEKCDRAKYISHLDLNRCMFRAVRRSKLPIWYTEGFNPRPYLVFALALSLGFESSCEVLDLRLCEPVPYDQIKARLNAALPPGLQVQSVGAPVCAQKEIAASDFSILLRASDPAACFCSLTDFLEKDEILAQKRTKRQGMQRVDIKPLMQVQSLVQTGTGLRLAVRLPAGPEKSYNPTLLLDAYTAWEKAVPYTVEQITREKIICADGQIFL